MAQGGDCGLLSVRFVLDGDPEVGGGPLVVARGTAKIELVAGVDRAQVMYNLTVHDDHDYFVGSGQWLVHNDSCQVGYGETPLSRKVRQWRIDNGNFLNSNVAAHDSLDKRAKRRILSDA